MTEEDRKRLEHGTALALEWHATQRRKGSGSPYVSHLFQVSGLVLQHGGDTDQAVAALLHDALEDAPTAEARRHREQTIRDRFGETVLAIILDCTDTRPEESIEQKTPWLERKTRYLTHLSSVDERSALVAACDKLHNLGSMVRDIRSQGSGFMKNFRGTPKEQVWFFEAVVDHLRGRVPRQLVDEIDDRLQELRDLL